MRSVEDRLLIRERYDSYSDAVFRSDVDAYLDCWIEDGLRISPPRECRGKTALRDQWLAIWRGLDRMTFFTQIGAMQVGDGIAHARCYCLESLHLKGGARRTVIGRYEDTLVRENGVWLFARRQYQVHMDEAAAPVS